MGMSNFIQDYRVIIVCSLAVCAPLLSISTGNAAECPKHGEMSKPQHEIAVIGSNVTADGTAPYRRTQVFISEKVIFYSWVGNGSSLKVESAYGLFPTRLIVNGPSAGSGEVEYTYDPNLDQIFANLSERPQRISVRHTFHPSPDRVHGGSHAVRTERSVRIAGKENIRIGSCVYPTWIIEDTGEDWDTGVEEVLRSWYSPDLRMILKEAGEVPHAITASATSQ